MIYLKNVGAKNLSPLQVAEREGFEPPEVLPSTVFKTAAIDRSAISPFSGGKNSIFSYTKCIGDSEFHISFQLYI